ncbi:M56 family metallopeptidase [Hyphococcus flavus]|uniref:M56 family metallopeptidase n=1 Tax=Hyphococcus flavus TaxID=1866326 RepID=A0AAE9ZJ73_9PROT|nr:M56 family metallopeptidase [Hyphococcus flavus]WDI31455.1 M56 family metallopeptidase [Hyphococcus flavus]
MINALIIVHLWSLVVAGGAWILQRDGNGRVGAHFPAPNIWFLLIILCLLPGALYLIPLGNVVSIPTTEAFEVFSIQANEFSTDGMRPLSFLAAYIGLGVFLMGRTLWRWVRLQSLPLAPTAEPDIFATPEMIPPLTLSWPRRAVVLPKGFEAQEPLIRHERAHLRHNDAEVTLLLLLLQDIMLRNPGIIFLVRQWRLAIELRADRAATRNLTAPERKDYAAFLLNIQRPTTRHNETLPCPTARLNSTPHRHAKMRLIGIIEDESSDKKRRWSAAVLSTFFAASGIGLLSAGAKAYEAGANAGSGPDDYTLIDYVKQTALQMPGNCPGLIDDIKARGVKIEEKELMINGRPVPHLTLNLGTVVLNHDVRKDGSIHNPRVIDSTHPCFEANAKAGIAQWTAAPQEFAIKDAAVKLHFVISGATGEELNQQLFNIAQ